MGNKSSIPNASRFTRELESSEHWASTWEQHHFQMDEHSKLYEVPLTGAKPGTETIFNLNDLPDFNLQDEEAAIGDIVFYVDGQEAVVIGYDDDCDLKVRKADGSTTVWYVDKCTRALRQIAVGGPVRYTCGEVAVVEGFDQDGDIKVKKADGSEATWYKNKCSGLEVPVSRQISRQISYASLMGA